MAAQLRMLQPAVHNLLPRNVDPISSILAKFKDIERAAKITGKLATIHDLRKSWCTRMARGGVPMHVLRVWAGHSSIEVTARYYTRVLDEDSVKLRAALTA